MHGSSSKRSDPEPGPLDHMEDFVQLYDSEMPRVYRYIRYHVPSVEEAEDLTADIFHRALRSWPRVHAELRSARAWLFTLARNRLTDYYRRRRIRSIFSLGSNPGVVADQPSPDELVIQREKVSTLMAKLGKLSERDRTILTLRFAGELSHRDIGRVLGISEAASSVALLRALRRLRRAYEGEDQ